MEAVASYAETISEVSTETLSGSKALDRDLVSMQRDFASLSKIDTDGVAHDIAALRTAAEEGSKASLLAEAQYGMRDIVDSDSFNGLVSKLLKSVKLEAAANQQPDSFDSYTRGLVKVGHALVREVELRRRESVLFSKPQPFTARLSKEHQLGSVFILESLMENIENEAKKKQTAVLIKRLAQSVNVAEFANSEIDSIYAKFSEALAGTPEALLPLAMVRGDLAQVLDVVVSLQAGKMSDSDAASFKDEALRFAKYSKNPVSTPVRFQSSRMLGVSADGRRLTSSNYVENVEVMLSPAMRVGVYYFELKLVKPGHFKAGICVEAPGINPIIKASSSNPFESLEANSVFGFLIDMDNQVFSVYKGGDKQGEDCTFQAAEVNLFLEVGKETELEITAEAQLPSDVVAVVLNGLADDDSTADIETAGALASYLLAALKVLADRRFAELSKVKVARAELISPSLVFNTSTSTFRSLIQLLDQDQPAREAALSILSVHTETWRVLRTQAEVDTETLRTLYEKVKSILSSEDFPVEESHFKLLGSMAAILDFSKEAQLERLVQALTAESPSKFEAGQHEQVLAVFDDHVGLHEVVCSYSAEEHDQLQAALFKDKTSDHRLAYQAVLFHLYVVKKTEVTTLDAWLSKVFAQAIELVTKVPDTDAENLSVLLTNLRLVEQAALLLKATNCGNINANTVSAFESLITTLIPLSLDGVDQTISTEEVVWESDHPATSQEFSIECENVREVVFKFDEQGQLSESAAFAVKAKDTVLTTQVTGELKVDCPKDLKGELKAGEQESWGFKATLTVKKTVEAGVDKGLKEIKHRLVSSFTHFFVSLVRTKEDNKEEAAKVLCSKLVKEGISEAVWRKLGHSSEIPDQLKVLAGSLKDAEEELPVFGRSMSTNPTFTRSTSVDLSSIEAYLGAFHSEQSYSYDKDFYLENLIEGKGAPAAAWTRGFELLKLNLRPTSRMGGENGASAERALFAVLLKLSGRLQEVKDLAADFPELKAHLASLWKHAHNIRQHLQAQTHAGKDSKEAADEVIKRCVLLLNARRKHFVIHQASESNPRERSSSFDDSLTPDSIHKLQLVKNIGHARTARPKTTQSEPWAGSVMSFVTSAVSFEDLYSEVTMRRNLALRRALALSQLDSLVQSDYDIAEVAEAVHQLFSKDEETIHFLSSLEGVDPRLQLSVAKSFFSIYRNLFKSLHSRLRFEADWLSADVISTTMKVLRILAFPFNYSDSLHLLSQDLHQPLEFLLSLASGKIRHSPERIQDLSTALTKFEVTTMRDSNNVHMFRENAFLNAYEDTEQKPVVAFEIAAEKEGWEKVQGNVGTDAAPLYVWLRRGDVGRVLKGLSSEAGVLSLEWTTQDDFAKEAATEVSKVRDSLKSAAWTVFRILSYSCIARPEEASTQDLKSLNSLQESFLYMLFNELKKASTPESAVFNVKESISGQTWSSAVAKVNLAKLALEQLTAQSINSPHIKHLLDKYAAWNKDSSYQPLSKAQISAAEGNSDEHHPEAWLDSNGNFDYIVALRNLQTSGELSETELQFLSSSGIVAALPSDLTQLQSVAVEFTKPSEFLEELIKRVPAAKSLLDPFVTSGNRGEAQANSDSPSAWLNSAGRLDLYCVLRAIIAEPYNYAELSQAFKTEFTRDLYVSIPVSCSLVNKLKFTSQLKTDPKYVQSLVWILTLSSHSESFCELASKSEFAIELCKLAFLSTDPFLAGLSFKILSKVLPLHYTPTSFEQLISSLDLKELKQRLRLEEAASVTSFFLNIAAQPACQASGVMASVLSTAFLQGAFSLLYQLLKHPEWQQSVLKSFEDAGQTLKNSLESDALPSLASLSKTYSSLLGTLSLFGTISSMGLEVQEGAKVEMLDGSTALLLTKGSQFTMIDESGEEKDQSSVKRALISAELRVSSLSDKQGFFEALLRLLSTVKALKLLKGENNEGLLAHRCVWQQLSTQALELIEEFFTDASIDCSAEQAAHLASLAKDWLTVSEASAGELMLQANAVQQVLAAYKEVEVVVEEEEKYPEMEEEEKQSDLNSLYILDAQTPMKCYGSDDSTLLANSSGHRALIGLGHFELSLAPQELFKNLNSKHGCPVLSILLALGSLDNSPIGFKIGELELKITKNGDVANMEGSLKQQHALLETQAKPTLEFKLIIDQVGSIQVNFGSATFEFYDAEAKVYNGFLLSPMQLTSYSSLVVRGMALYEGLLTEDVNFWIENSEPFNKSCEVVDRLVMVSPGTTYRQERAIENLIEAPLSALPQTVLSRLDHGLNIDLNTSLIDPIVEIRIFETVAQVPLNFELVPVIQGDLTLSTQDLSKKVVAVRRAPLKDADSILTSISIQATSEEKPGLDLLGNISKDDKEEVIFYRLLSTKLTISSFITRLAFFKCPKDKVVLTSTFSPCLFVKNKLKLDGLGVPVLQLSRDEDLMFLCYSEFSELAGIPVKPISIGGKTEEKQDLGIVDSFTDQIDNESIDNVKKWAAAMSSWPKHSLRAMLYDMSAKRAAHQAVKTLVRLFAGHPAIGHEFFVSSESLRLLTSSCLGKLDLVKLPLLKACEEADVQAKVLSEGLSTLLLGGTRDNSAVQLTPVVVESPHPYLNNMQHREIISIPGASSLLVEFDSQCKTENSCDTMYFYRKPDSQEEIGSFTGEVSNFKTTSIEGDTFHLYFRTDGSVVYWGYKFTVTPQSKIKAKLPVEFLAMKNRSLATSLWVLELLPAVALKKQASVHILTLFAYNSREESHRLQALNLLKKAMGAKEQVEVLSLGDSPRDKVLKKYLKDLSYEEKASGADLLMSSLQELSFFEKTKSTKSKKTILLEACLGGRTNEIETTSDTSNRSSHLVGLTKRGPFLTLSLLQKFIKDNADLTTLTFESEHPYLRQTQTSLVSYPFASRMLIDEDPACRAEIGHSLLVSSDEAGVRLNRNFSMRSEPFPVTFLPNTSTNIKVDGATLTRECSGDYWQNLVLTPVFSKGIFRVQYTITQLGCSSDFIMGFHKMKLGHNSKCCTMPGNGFADVSYCYRGNGELQMNGQYEGCSSLTDGAVFEMLVDLDRSSATFYLNSTVLKTFTILPEEYQAHMCYGSTEAALKITKFEASGTEIKLGSTVHRVNDSSCYLHFPANAFCFREFFWRTTNKAAFNRLKSILSQPETALEAHFSETPIKPGTNSVCFRIDYVNSGILHVGVAAPKDLTSPARTLPNFFVYSSTGELSLNGKMTMTEPFTEGDLIEVVTDTLSRSISFFKNQSLVKTGQFLTKLNLIEMFAAAWTEIPGQQISLVDPSNKQPFFTGEGRSTEWGTKVKVTPIVESIRGLRVLESFQEAVLTKWDEYAQKQMQFSLDADKQLVQLIDSIKSKDANAVFDPKPEDLLKYPALTRHSLKELKDRHQLFTSINEGIKAFIENMDLSDFNSTPESSDLVSAIKDFVFFEVKFSLFKSVTDKTGSDNREDIPINKLDAHVRRDRGDVDSENRYSVFSQVMRICNLWKATQLRNRERAFHCTFKGEGASDAGGPYNEVISTMCDELMSPFLPLFVPSTNRTQDVGLNRDCFVINPKALSAMHQDMYFFLGKLFGIALRTQNNLNLFLPPLFWKKLALEAVTIDDLRSTDVGTVNSVEALRGMKNLSEEEFMAVFDDLTFTTKDSSGAEVELVPGGKRRSVKVADIEEYCDAVINFRLHENDEAYIQMRKGISMMIPIDLLALFSWKQFEFLVCGAPTVDVARLKNNSTCDGYAADSDILKWFWEVLTEMTDEERSMFLRFVWGRTRLPAAGTFRTFTISEDAEDDNKLPVSHTCFFSLDLPKYSSKVILKKKLLYAISNCQAIDLDYMPGE
jgi:hypothetical protein